jgi:hypothetical protein
MTTATRAFMIVVILAPTVISTALIFTPSIFLCIAKQLSDLGDVFHA